MSLSLDFTSTNSNNGGNLNMASDQNPIKFFDIASGPPKRCYAPNPWKTRFVSLHPLSLPSINSQNTT